MPITIQFEGQAGATSANIYAGPGAAGDLPSNPVTVPAIAASGIGVLTISSWTTRPSGLVVIESGGYRSTARIVADTDEYEFMPSEETSFAVAVADEIQNRGINTIPIQSGVNTDGSLVLIQGDTYDGSAKPLLPFPTTLNYTSGWTATLTIRDEDDAIVATAAGVVASSTLVTVSMTAPTGLTFEGCPGSWQGKFDVQMSKASQRATIASGKVYVYEDQTRT